MAALTTHQPLRFRATCYCPIGLVNADDHEEECGQGPGGEAGFPGLEHSIVHAGKIHPDRFKDAKVAEMTQDCISAGARRGAVGGSRTPERVRWRRGQQRCCAKYNRLVSRSVACTTPYALLHLCLFADECICLYKHVII